MEVSSSGGDQALKPILIIAYNYPPRVTSGAIRPSRFARYLPEHGYRVRIIAAPYEPEPFPEQVHRVPAPGRAPWRLRFAEWWHDGVQSLVSPYNERLPWVPYVVDAASRLLHAPDAPVAVFSTSPPLATHVAALRLKRRFPIRWIADFRDPLLGNPFYTNRRALLYYRQLERAILRHADAVIANTEPLTELLKARYPGREREIVHLPNGYDPEECFGPAPIPARPHRVLAHVGGLYGGRHPGKLLASLDRLIARGAVAPGTIRVELTGGMEPQIGALLNSPAFARLRELGCLQFEGVEIPREAARRETAEADYLLLLDLNEQGAGLQVPAKLYDYVLVGRPILAFTHRQSACAEILARSGVPHVRICDTDPEEETDRAVLEFLQLPTEPAPCSEEFRRRYDVRSQTRQLAGILDRILRPPNGPPS